MKTTILFMITIFLILALPSSGQEIPIKNNKSLHEISIQPYGFISYGFLKKLNSKFYLGAKFGLGVGAMYRIGGMKGWYYKNIQLGIIGRSTLLNYKGKPKLINDISLFANASLMIPEDLDVYKRFGIEYSVYYKWKSLLIGFSLQFSAISILTTDDYEFPLLEIIPISLTYQF